MARDIKKEMMELLGGEFLDWYSNLNDEEKKQYSIEFNKLQDNDIPHSDIRRMESEGVYEEKFSEKIPQWTQSHSGASEHGVFFNDEWNSKVEYSLTKEDTFESNDSNKSKIFDESHALDVVLNDMVEDDDLKRAAERYHDVIDKTYEAARPYYGDLDEDMDIQDFEDGVDERPIKKETEYNDEEFDY